MLSSEFMLFPLQRPMVLPSGEIDLFREHLVSDSQKPGTGSLCTEFVRNNLSIFGSLKNAAGNSH